MWHTAEHRQTDGHFYSIGYYYRICRIPDWNCTRLTYSSFILIIADADKHWYLWIRLRLVACCRLVASDKSDMLFNINSRNNMQWMHEVKAMETVTSEEVPIHEKNIEDGKRSKGWLMRNKVFDMSRHLGAWDHREQWERVSKLAEEKPWRGVQNFLTEEKLHIKWWVNFLLNRYLQS